MTMNTQKESNRACCTDRLGYGYLRAGCTDEVDLEYGVFFFCPLRSRPSYSRSPSSKYLCRLCKFLKPSKERYWQFSSGIFLSLPVFTSSTCPKLPTASMRTRPETGEYMELKKKPGRPRTDIDIFSTAVDRTAEMNILETKEYEDSPNNPSDKTHKMIQTDTTIVDHTTSRR